MNYMLRPFTFKSSIFPGLLFYGIAVRYQSFAHVTCKRKPLMKSSHESKMAASNVVMAIFSVASCHARTPIPAATASGCNGVLPRGMQ